MACDTQQAISLMGKGGRFNNFKRQRGKMLCVERIGKLIRMLRRVEKGGYGTK